MKKRYIAGMIAGVAAWHNADAKLWINEIMQSNIDGVFMAGDFPDSWFEIYNDGDNAVRLNDYRVGDSDDFEKAFVLSGSVGVGAKGYNLIYCDKVGSGYHTDFRIDSGKGKLYLFDPQGEIVDYVSYPKMPAPNVAYGRAEDASQEWGYELCPTPRAANGGGITSVTHSYIYHPRDAAMPIVSINTSQDYFDDPAIGFWNNFEQNWRRPVNVEYFTELGEESVINQLGELRIHGGWSRNQVQKSLAVYANKRFGTKRYGYAFWDDRPDVGQSKSFVLRNGGNAFTEARINDSFVQTLFGRNCDNLDWQAYRAVICYINGRYRGIYALRQRSNEDYVEDCYDGLEDIDMLENWDELKVGTIDSFEALKGLYENNPDYQQMSQAIDVENFANLYIADAAGRNVTSVFPSAGAAMVEIGGKGIYVVEVSLAKGSRTVSKVAVR